MAITLSYNGTTAQLGDRLIWSNEFGWSPVAQVAEPGTTGALMVHVGVRSAGRPITLDGVESKAWISRALCASLQAWSELPGIVMTLVLRGVSRQVIFDHQQGGFEAVPVWRIADGQETPEQVLLPTFRFLTTDGVT
jgi:hypothetical protein